MSSRSYPSTASLVSTHAKPAAPTTPKNYESAFGSLASRYGCGGVAPSLPPKGAYSTKQPAAAVPATPATNQPSSGAAKNYEAAFGALSSTYGLGAGYFPSPYNGKK